MPTAIEWTEETWNPVTGCSKVSPGCAHCYAETLTERFAGQPGWIPEHRPWTPENAAHNVVLHPERLEQPRRWSRRRVVFVNSMSDLFHELVPDEFIAQVFETMRWAQRHTFQVLTKRPERARDWFAWYEQRYVWREQLNRKLYRENVLVCFPEYEPDALDRHVRDQYPATWPLPNVWLGVSIENARHTWRADVLREIPAAVRFLSCEPLLGSLFEHPRGSLTVPVVDGELQLTGEDLQRAMRETSDKRAPLDLTGIDWVIVGGESGKDARPMHPDWACEIRDACLARCPLCGAGDPCHACPSEGRRPAFFFKQWGEWAPADQSGVRNVRMSERRWQYASRRFAPDGTDYIATQPDLYSYPGMESLLRVGKRRAGRQLDGRTWDEMPVRT